MRISAIAFIAVAGLAAAAHGAVTYNSTLSIPFTPPLSAGQSNTNFAISTQTDGGNTVELGLKAKERFFGDTYPIVNGLYTVQPGFSPISGSNPLPDPTRAEWNFDFSIDLGTRTFGNTDVTLTITDVDGGAPLPILFKEPTFAGINSASVFQDSWNRGFAFLTPFLGPMDAFQPGDYLFSLSATDPSNANASLGQVDIVVNVVPAPGAAALLGAGGLMTLRRRRR